jgi:hypothetical protein
MGTIVFGVMRPSATRQPYLATTIALALSLACGLSSASTPTRKADAASAVSNATIANELADTAGLIDTWRDYALGTLKSNFAWASEPSDVIEAPSIFNRGRSNLSRAPALRFPGTSVQQDGALHVAMQSTRVADTPLYASAEASTLLPDFSPGLRRLIVAPSFTHRVGDSNSFSVAAILAYQRVAGGFDLAGMSPGSANSWLTPTQFHNAESGFGAAARLDFNHAMNDWASWQVGYQSRVNMDGFNTYQGLNVRPGSFDIPASTNVGLGLKITPDLRVDVGVERIMYGDVAPLISNSLPAPLLAQLGGSRLSSSFAWENLVVRSLALSWHAQALGDIGLRYTSRQQPLPTLPLLQQALLPDISSHNWEVSFARGFGQNSTLRLLGVYAPIQLFGAPATSYGLNGANGSSQIRVEALWVTTF